MQFVREFTGLPTEELASLVAGATEPFLPSELYEVASATKIHDPERRVSEFRLLRDPRLFDACDKLVEVLTEKDEYNSYVLIRNDATHIRYGPGGFFKGHKDFLSLTSNCIEEYTLIVSLQPSGTGEPLQGGLTRVVINSNLILESSATVTPGSALLLRKDLFHEGLAACDSGREAHPHTQPLGLPQGRVQRRAAAHLPAAAVRR